jgi:hypothetical protein
MSKYSSISLRRNKVISIPIDTKPYIVLRVGRAMYPSFFKLNNDSSYSCVGGGLKAYLKGLSLYHDRECRELAFRYDEVKHLTKKEYDKEKNDAMQYK